MSEALELVFGGKPYSLPQLTALKARAWRAQLIESAHALSDTLFRTSNGHDENFFSGLATAYLGFPDKILEMVFAYGKQLPQEEIRASATDDEIIAAFAQVMRAGFPYLDQLSLMVSFDLASRMDEAGLDNLQHAAELSSESPAKSPAVEAAAAVASSES